MKILLIRPHSNVPSAAPPLGLLYLSAYLRQNGGITPTICDARFREYNFDQIEEIIREEKPDLLGITSFSLESKEAHEIAKRGKKAIPGMSVVVGGPYATSDYEQALADPNIDIAVIGEAEKSFHQLVMQLQSGEDWTQIRELAYRRNGSLAKTEMREFIADLDELPYPAWDLINLEEYFNRRGTRKRTCFNQHQMRQRVLSIFTTRGCPYRCTYCHNLFGKKLRKRSVENVIGEMRLMKDQYGVEEVEIIDDIFNLDMDRAKLIFRRIIEEKLDFKFSFPNGLRTDRLDEELLDLFKQGKAQTNIAAAAKRGFSMGGFFMMGFLEETEEEIWNTIYFALRSKLQTAAFFIVTPFPNTDIWRQAQALGLSLSADYEHYQKVSANISKVPTARLTKLRKIAFRRFYLNPWRLWSFIRTTPWRDRFFEKVWILIAASFFKYEK